MYLGFFLNIADNQGIFTGWLECESVKTLCGIDDTHSTHGITTNEAQNRDHGMECELMCKVNTLR